MVGAVLELVLDVLLDGLDFRRQAPAGSCTRCRKRPGWTGAPAVGAERLCEECARAVRRNYRAATLFFGGLAVLMGVLGALVAASTLWRVPLSGLLDPLAILVLAPGLPGLAAWRIHRATKSRPLTIR